MFRITNAIIMVCILVSLGLTKDGSEKIQTVIKQYYNSALEQVNQADTPSQQRQILNRSLDKLVSVLGTLQTWPDFPQSELLPVQKLRQRFVDKQDELQGRNGYERVPDEELVTFAKFIQQEIESAGLFPILGLANAIVMVFVFLMN